MPSTSKKQHNFMAAVAKNPAFAKKVGVPRSVGEEFLTADKGKKFRSGGMAKKEHAEKGEMKADIKQDKAIVKKAIGMHDKQLHGGKKTNLAALKKGGVAKTIDMCGGGKAKGHAAGGRIASKGEHPVQTKSKRGAEMVKMVTGGYVRKADGIAKRGLTRGAEPKMMKKGGKC